MRRFVGNVIGEKAIVEGQEFLHLKNVLRMQEGERIVVICDDEFEYFCKIEKMSKKDAVCSVFEKRICKGMPKKEILLFQAMIKRENFEIVLQKACELGVGKIIPFTSQFTNQKDQNLNHERLEKIIQSASKQCENSKFLKIEKTKTFEQMTECLAGFDVILFANEREGENFEFSHLKNVDRIAIVVGCEGGFSAVEKQKILEQNVCSVGLGERILRSETASIVLCGIASVLGEN